MRKVASAAALLMALAALSAAKPVPADAGPGALDANREYWRGQTISICVAELRTVPALSPDDLESICGCATDRVLASQGSGPLPPIARPLPLQVRGRMTSCTIRIHPDAASAVARLDLTDLPTSLPETMPAPPTPVTAPKPVDQADTGPPPQSGSQSESGGGFGEWLRSLTLPAWLTGADALLWVALGILVFGLLIMKVRRRDPRNDLLGPPSSMRRGVPLPPRRPDLPRQ